MTCAKKLFHDMCWDVALLSEQNEEFLYIASKGKDSLWTRVHFFWRWEQTRVQDGLLDRLGSGTMRVRVVRQTDVACSKKPQFVVSPHAAAVQGACDTWTQTTGNAYNMLRSVNIILPTDCCVLPSAIAPQDPAGALSQRRCVTWHSTRILDDAAVP